MYMECILFIIEKQHSFILSNTFWYIYKNIQNPLHDGFFISTYLTKQNIYSMDCPLVAMFDPYGIKKWIYHNPLEESDVQQGYWHLCFSQSKSLLIEQNQAQCRHRKSQLYILVGYEDKEISTLSPAVSPCSTYFSCQYQINAWKFSHL